MIKKIRDKLNMSQPVFAMKVRVPESSLKKWELGSILFILTYIPCTVWPDLDPSFPNIYGIGCL
jgi:transcriptional regulator with XRE-family HTH domain